MSVSLKSQLTPSALPHQKVTSLLSCISAIWCGLYAALTFVTLSVCTARVHLYGISNKMTFSPKITQLHSNTEWAIMSVHPRSLLRPQTTFAPRRLGPLPERHGRRVLPGLQSSKTRGDDTRMMWTEGALRAPPIVIFQQSFVFWIQSKPCTKESRG